MRALVVIAAVLSLGASGRSSTIAVSASHIVTANPDSESVSILDASTRAVVSELRLRATPQTIAIDGARAFVALREGSVAVIDLATQRVERTAHIGVEPFGVATGDGRLYVSDAAAAVVHVVDAATLARIATIPTKESPRGLALDAQRLYVTHFRSGEISVIDTATLAVTKVITTGADSNLSEAVVLANGRAYAPQTRSNTTNQALLFDTTVFPIVSVLDLTTQENLPRERLAIDIVDRPSNMPTDAVLTSGNVMYVVLAGNDAVSVIDLATKKTKVKQLTVGKNPRGIALSADERFAFVNNALSGSVSVIDTATNAVVETTAVTTIPLPPDILNGKILFYTSADERLAKDRWISCATCHPDGGTDGRTWFFRDGPRNTPPLFATEQSMPMHWSGDLDELQDVESTIRLIQAGSGLASGALRCMPACDRDAPHTGVSQDLDDLAAFMRTLRAPRRTFETTDASRRGAEVFARANCASCHSGAFFSDGLKHDAGTGSSAQERKGSAFDTPTLRGLFDTAPYLHDGSAATLQQAVAAHVSTLSAAELDDLAAYLKTIPFPQLKRRAVR
ncbi:MAG TPA: cytochrome D1 domain-containing protein [Thermoanaerobaculia bacterium]|nr:cytochrome D1 domain-containing protein [Thermoanaerobaculia bacterium]